VSRPEMVAFPRSRVFLVEGLGPVLLGLLSLSLSAGLFEELLSLLVALVLA